MRKNLEKIGYLAMYKTSNSLRRVVNYLYDIEAIASGGRGAVYGTIFALPVSILSEILTNKDGADIVFHSTISAAFAGYFSKKHGLKYGLLITFGAGVVWEIAEQIFQIKSNEDWFEDTLANMMGYVFYPVGEFVLEKIPKIRNGLEKYTKHYKQKLDEMNSE